MRATYVGTAGNYLTPDKPSRSVIVRPCPDMMRGVAADERTRIPVVANHDADRDRSRLEDLYRAHARHVLAYARRRVPYEDANEVVAETFLTAWRRLEAVPDHALPWLLGVARKVVSNQRRSAKRRGALVSKLERIRPRASMTQTEAADLVSAAVDSLPERQREALKLCFWDDLDAATAAKVAGCSRRVFAARLYRGRRRLARELAALDMSFVREGRLARPTRKEATEE